MTPPSTAASLDEARDFLARHPDIEAFDLILTDANGVGRGKIIRRHELESIYKTGRGMPSSILGLDITGDDVHATGLTWDTGDGDLLAWPVPGSLVPLYGTKPARGQVLLSMYHPDGTPMLSDPRNVLARQLQAFEQRGLRPAGAFELEFFLLDPERDSNGRIRPAKSVIDGHRSNRTEVYSVDHLHDMEPLISDIYAAAKAQGLPVETIISEYAPGQYELTLHYRNDLLRAADDLIMLKRVVRMQARRYNIIACFMAKPSEEYAGSGMHLHISMPDKGGHNIYAEKEKYDWKPVLLHSMGGLIATMPESMLVFAPHANSWRRFVAQSYAPISPTWGVNNRSVALRIPEGDVRARRIEHRPAGVDSNPYLVAATVLAGIAHGIDENIDPGPMITGNGYENSTSTSVAISTDWRDAIDAAKASGFLKSALGDEMHRTFTAIKEAEYLRVARTVSELDYQLYMHEV